MLVRSLVSILFFASSFTFVLGQTLDGQKTDVDKVAKTPSQKLRDIPLSAGVDLQFLIKELARDMDLNVLFDNESFRTAGRRVSIELKNVTAAEALDYIFLQEGLCFEEAGQKTILVALQAKQRSIPQIGVGVLPMRDQLAQYFGVDGGLLIDWVRGNSPASKAGLKAGDVIVEIDGVLAKGALGVVRAINDKKDRDVVLTIVRERRSKEINLIPEKSSVGSIVQKSF